MERLKQKADGSKWALKTFKGYAAPSESVIKIFKNRIEFFNPGKLAEGLPISTLNPDLSWKR